jgi:hypothetical protein
MEASRKQPITGDHNALPAQTFVTLCNDEAQSGVIY